MTVPLTTPESTLVLAAEAEIRNAIADGKVTTIHPTDAISAYRQHIADTTDELRLVRGLTIRPSKRRAGASALVRRGLEAMGELLCGNPINCARLQPKIYALRGAPSPQARWWK